MFQWAIVILSLCLDRFMTGLHHALSVTVGHCNTVAVFGQVYDRVKSCFECYSGPL